MKRLVLLPALVLTTTLVLLPLMSDRATAQEGKANTARIGPRWEYRVLRIDSTRPEEVGRTPRARSGQAEAQLNKLGEQGWELVTVRLDGSSPAASPIFYFKRPK